MKWQGPNLGSWQFPAATEKAQKTYMDHDFTAAPPKDE